MNQRIETRRKFLSSALKIAGVGTLLASSLPVYSFDDGRNKERYKISVCDWMILKRQKLGAFELASKIGADGVELDMGGLGKRETFDSKLIDPTLRSQFLNKCKDLDMEISSMAMSGFYAQSFAEREHVDRMVQDCIETMKLMKVKVAFLPLGVQSDLVKYPHLRPVVIERLRQIAPKAEEAGVIIGIETALDAQEEVKLLDEVNSRAIQSYFNFSNALQNGRDVCAELEILGRKRICQIHCTDEDGVWLENNTRLDLRKVKKTLDKMKWRGWLVVERSRDANDPRNVLKNFTANVTYLKSIFQA